MNDPFLHDIYTSSEAENYFSKLVGEEVAWLTNSWNASHMNVQAESGLDTKIFDWHCDSQPLTVIINVSDMPKEVIGGSTILRRHDDGSEIELKQPAPGENFFREIVECKIKRDFIARHRLCDNISWISSFS